MFLGLHFLTTFRSVTCIWPCLFDSFIIMLMVNILFAVYKKTWKSDRWNLKYFMSMGSGQGCHFCPGFLSFYNCFIMYLSYFYSRKALFWNTMTNTFLVDWCFFFFCELFFRLEEVRRGSGSTCVESATIFLALILLKDRGKNFKSYISNYKHVALTNLHI